MATTRKKTTRRKSTPAKSTARKRRSYTSRKTTSTRRRRKTKPKGMLHDLTNPVVATNTMKCLLEGGLGAYVLQLVDKALPNSWNPSQKSLAKLGTAFVVGAVGKRPMMAAGMAGAAIDSWIKDGGSLEALFDGGGDYNYADANVLRMYPPMLNDQFDLSDQFALYDASGYNRNNIVYY